MKRVIKKITALTLILVMGLSLVACGSKEDNGDGSKGNSGNETKSGYDNTYTFSEYLNKGDDYQIWYYASELDKDNWYHVVIVKDGKAVFVYGDSEKYPTLGDVAQATDEEIYQEFLVVWRNQIQGCIEKIQNDIAETKEQYDPSLYNDPSNKDGVAGMLQTYEEQLAYLQNLDTSDFDFQEYTIGISTDATGNHTETEFIRFETPYYNNQYYNNEVRKDEIQPLSSVAPEFYDSRYKGFADKGYYFFTRVEDSSVVITADEPGAEGVTVD